MTQEMTRNPPLNKPITEVTLIGGASLFVIIRLALATSLIALSTSFCPGRALRRLLRALETALFAYGITKSSTIKQMYHKGAKYVLTNLQIEIALQKMYSRKDTF